MACVRVTAIGVAVFFWQACAPAVQAQPSASEEARQTYTKLCSGCHGDDARGTQQGPGLAGNPSVRRRSVQSLKNVIANGVPGAGMPGFKLSEATLNALAGMVVSLNAVAAEQPVEGDRAAGREFFLGKGQCSSCHMVSGEGSATGPDLSNVARELTVDQIREALLRPSARIAPGYDLVTAHLRNGKSIKGFARSRSSFSVVIQDLTGDFHPLASDAVSSWGEEKQSLDARPAEQGRRSEKCCGVSEQVDRGTTGSHDQCRAGERHPL